MIARASEASLVRGRHGGNVESYDDEVANISEALADDRLSPVGGSALAAALSRSKATRIKLTDAFGGGE